MDPVADMLTIIRNANAVLLPSVDISYSKMKASIAEVLRKEGYIAAVEILSDKFKTIRLQLKYSGRKGVIAGLKKASKPGLRYYVGVDEIPKVLGGMGIAVLSTSRGIMTGAEARKQNVGGEVLCYVW